MDKATIIAAIKKVAAENGGVAPGVQRFQTVTGMRESDWKGKYWARWGDALLEAGLAPNSFQAAYADDILLERLAQVTREMGRFPVVAELKMRSRSDPEFPSTGAFRRLGNKAQLLDQLREFCAARPEWADVGANCVNAKSSSEPAICDTAPEQSSSYDELGHVYLAKSGKFWELYT